MRGEWYAVAGLGLLSVGFFVFAFSILIRISRRRNNRIDRWTRADLLEAIGLLLMAAGALILVFILFSRGLFWIIEAPMTLLVGWVLYLNRVERLVEPDVMTVVSGLVCAIGVVIGTHFFLRWLSSTASRPWPVKRTLQLLALVVLMFVSGVAVTGLVQQMGWLVRTPEPLVRDARSLR